MARALRERIVYDLRLPHVSSTFIPLSFFTPNLPCVPLHARVFLQAYCLFQARSLCRDERFLFASSPEVPHPSALARSVSLKTLLSLRAAELFYRRSCWSAFDLRFSALVPERVFEYLLSLRGAELFFQRSCRSAFELRVCLLYEDRLKRLCLILNKVHPRY
ncbi:hypothetical protein NDU88_011042 [Pleurodeles waltl]|uniref:Uncharacterized protein n=1 Tax=Pleurodeles waltl TaxID=8319 RepID=A0AAV7S334_PLEWA|nr:hypothetical protein NDU88_011042 [Pleurodeles waltl]